jgi:hypothetical protein
MRKTGLSALVVSALAALLLPASALAAKPAVTTGSATKLTFQSARLNGSVDPNKEATTFYFQYGTTIALGSQTAPVSAGAGGSRKHAFTDVAGLAPVTKYYYRIVGHNSSGTVLGKRRSFKTRRQPLGLSLVADPNPVPAAHSQTLVRGNLSGTNNAGRQVVLQASTWPYTAGFQNASNGQVTDVNGNFGFPLLSVAQNTQYRVVMPERPDVVSPIVAFGVKPYVKAKVSRHRVRRGHRVRVSGSIKPAAADQQVAFQKKSSGEWVTVGGTKVRSGGKYSGRLKVRRGGSYRVWTGDTLAQYASNHSRTFKIKTFR